MPLKRDPPVLRHISCHFRQRRCVAAFRAASPGESGSPASPANVAAFSASAGSTIFSALQRSPSAQPSQLSQRRSLAARRNTLSDKSILPLLPPLRASDASYYESLCTSKQPGVLLVTPTSDTQRCRTKQSCVYLMGANCQQMEKEAVAAPSDRQVRA